MRLVICELWTPIERRFRADLYYPRSLSKVDGMYATTLRITIDLATQMNQLLLYVQ